MSNQPDLTAQPRIGRSVSLDTAAEMLGVSRRTIYNRIRDGRLQTIRTPGGSQRVLLGSLPHAQASEPWLPPAPAVPRPNARVTTIANA